MQRQCTGLVLKLSAVSGQAHQVKFAFLLSSNVCPTESRIPKVSLFGLLLFHYVDHFHKCMKDRLLSMFADDTSVFVKDNECIKLISCIKFIL